MFNRKIVEETFDLFYNELFRKLDNESEINFGERYTESHKWRIIRDVLLLPPLSSNDRVLEIGPSLTSLIIKKLTGATVETLCIDDLNRNFLTPYNVPLHLCDITTEVPPLEINYYDCILFCEVFEHFMRAPQFALKNIMALLKPGKHLFFSVPNFATIQKRVMLLRGKNPQDLLSDKIPYYAHIREPVYSETKQWWEEAGGTIVQEGFTNYDRYEPSGFLSKLFWTARFLKIRNGFGLAHIWFPHTRRYFYFLISK
jgi:SAM-dependent methyltransferase